VAVVTGAGGGLGRAEALALAAAGAAVVVNDTGSTADEVAEEIGAAGGRAVACRGDVTEWATGQALLTTAVETFGGLDILVNNAGIVRDRMVFNMSEQEWDAVLRVHLKGHFVTTRLATAFWRERSRGTGQPVSAAIVNTASEAFLTGSPGQANYASAKAGIAALTLSTARGCARYGVRANAICPRARTAMTESVFAPAPVDGPDPMTVDQVTPLVVYLAGPRADNVTGQVFVVYGGTVQLMAAPTVERTFASTNPAWSDDDVADQLSGYFADRDPARGFAAMELMADG
jgi:3-oxoacyl-[acyl-carrier protein] reductase